MKVCDWIINVSDPITYVWYEIYEASQVISAVLDNEHPLSSITVKLYVPPVNPWAVICCGLLGTLLDQLNINGGVPDEINAVKVPSEPVPQEVLYKL